MYFFPYGRFRRDEVDTVYNVSTVVTFMFLAKVSITILNKVFYFYMKVNLYLHFEDIEKL